MTSQSQELKSASTNADDSPLASLKAAYLEKRRDYFECSRPEVLNFFPKGVKRVLDVGCGTGSFGESVKVSQNCEVWGVEPDAEAAKAASNRLDRVFTGFFGEETGLPAGFFDCVCFNDVLEHMVDPTAALKYAAKLLTKDGRILTSIPNIRHFPTLWRLAVQGNWDYTERGILDKTHLRFFTANTIVRFFESEGFAIERMEGINGFADMISGDTKLWKIYRLVSLWPTRLVKEMRYLQFVVVARRKNPVA
jgi:2-polyprenyl-3-methyl-5-hydroxy-6-metoxy-1,4-benzoquinol methylase